MRWEQSKWKWRERREGQILKRGRWEFTWRQEVWGVEIKWMMVCLPKMPSVRHRVDKEQKREKREKRKNETVTDWYMVNHKATKGFSLYFIEDIQTPSQNGIKKEKRTLYRGGLWGCVKYQRTPGLFSFSRIPFRINSTKTSGYTGAGGK